MSEMLRVRARKWTAGTQGLWLPDGFYHIVYLTSAAVMGLYTRGGTVFTVGDWSHGLKGDATVAQITRNILDRLSQ